MQLNRFVHATFLAIFVLIPLWGTAPYISAAEYNLPDRVAVMPVAFVPSDQKAPTSNESSLFIKHIVMAQKRYGELLNGDTFELAKPTVQVVRGQRPLDFYRKGEERGAPEIVSELLTHFKVSRFECPHVYCILLMNSRDSFPEGGGRTINGGMNTGGGMMYIASSELMNNKHFQCTLQHELGHGFGLCHVNAYGYDMNSNASIMSYNPAHHNVGFTASPTPGVLIPEDRRALALNKRVFAKVTFDPERDVPAGYKLARQIVPLGPMTLPEQPNFYPQVTTDGGEELGSKVANVVMQEIQPSAGPGITYNPGTMWHSKPLPGGEAKLEITFPCPVRLTDIAIHSQHSGIDHHVTAMQLEGADSNKPAMVANQPVKSVDEVIKFPAATATKWHLTLKTGPSKILVIRGLQFFDGDKEFCPHMVPYQTQPTGPATVVAETPAPVRVSPSAGTFDEATAVLLEQEQRAEKAAATDDYAGAIQILQAAAATLQKPELSVLKEHALAEVKRYAAYQKIFDAAKPSREKLAMSPTDPKANATWGRYQCFYKGEWKLGIPLLAKSDDSIWKSLAQRELAESTDPNAWLKLGDDWLRASEKERDPIRFQTREHALEVWTVALSKGSEKAQVKLAADVDQRLGKWFGKAVGVAKGDAEGVPLPRTQGLNPGQDFTLEFWVNTTSTSGALVSKHHVPADQSMQLRISPGKVHYEFAFPAGNGGTESNTTISDGRWHHLAIVKKAGLIDYYVDGSPVAQFEMNDAVSIFKVAESLPSISVWKLGCALNRPPCPGRFAGIRISNVARYPQQFTPSKQYRVDAATRYLVQEDRDDRTAKLPAK